MLKDGGDELDTEQFKAWREDYANAEFILEDGKFITGREVGKNVEIKIQRFNTGYHL
jgi:hypothetical protein